MPFDGGVTEAALLAGAADAGAGAAATAGTAAATDAALTAGALGASDVAATGALAGGADLAATGALASGAGAGAGLAGSGALAGGTGAGLLGTGAADLTPAVLGVTSSTPADIGLLSTTATPALSGATMAADPAMAAMNAGQDIAASGNVIGTAAPTVTTDAAGNVMSTGLPHIATDTGGTVMTGGQAGGGGDIFSKIGAKWSSMTLGQKLQAGGTLASGLSGAKGLATSAPTAGNQQTMRPGTPGSPRGGEALISAIVQQMLQRRNQAMSAQLGQTGQPIVYAPTTGLLGF